MTCDLERRMTEVLSTLNLPFKVVWQPDCKQKNHGHIDRNTIYIFDSSEEDAWRTFLHEIFELKLKRVTTPYRSLVNSLIETIENLVYREKEQFLEDIPSIIRLVEKARGKTQPPQLKGVRNGKNRRS